MKKPELSTPQYQYLVGDYRQWLATLGYSDSSIKSFPGYLYEMLLHLEGEQGIRDIRLVKPAHMDRHVNHLHHRRNQRTGAGLGAHSINHHITAINLFARYLHLVAGHTLDTSPKRPEPPIGERDILTVAEIRELYAQTFGQQANNPTALGRRDRAIIAVYYGCGLRKREGEELDLHDVDLENARLLVRKGKGNRERYVPIARKHLEDLRDYMEGGRHWFTESHAQAARDKPPRKKKKADGQALFLSQRGCRMRGGLYVRVRKLVKRAGIQKEIGLHSLRHSIATHLLQAGMPLEEIGKFLGHATLDSTQVYTHIAHVLKMRELEDGGPGIR